ncbi:MAG: GerMN domain-containing protein [Clostridia bacterium]|nr:GerMN domain-containing protein [Clostridia bacterium]
MKRLKMPKIRFKRANIERALIGCSAMLVLLLSVQSRDIETEPYEEPLEDIPPAQAAVSAGSADMQQTVVYYEDGDGYLVPVQREVLRQDGIARATLELMVQNARNDMDAARLGLSPVVPEGTTFELDIADGHARVDLGREALSAGDKQQEENMRTAIVWALTEFDTVKDVNFLVDGQKRDTLTHGTNISGSYTRVGLNQEEPAVATFAGANEVQMYFPAQDGRLLVPVSRTVYSDDDVATAVFEFLRGPKDESGLEKPLDSDVKLLGVSVKDGVVTINFSSEFTKIAEHSDAGVQAMRALMMTCTRYPGIKKVKILVDGKPYQVPVDDVPTFANVAAEVENSYPEVMLIE